jgi:hypothetical protein
MIVLIERRLVDGLTMLYHGDDPIMAAYWTTISQYALPQYKVEIVCDNDYQEFVYHCLVAMNIPYDKYFK